jgi:hypothetical protein
MVGIRITANNRRLRLIALSSVIMTVLMLSYAGMAAATTVTSSGALGLEGTIPSAPPSVPATISVPSDGQTFTSSPITVSGICPTGLLIKIFDNNAFVGSTICSNGSYKLQVSLFSGQNSLTAEDYDALGQSGPASNAVSVNFDNSQYLQFGNPLSLTSTYAEKGAAPGDELTWPIILTGGTGPYAISVDWGDGSSEELLSVQNPGTINISNTYKTSGVYGVLVKATDKNGQEAFLQLVGQATGAIQHNDKATATGGNQIIEREVIWWPEFLTIILIFIAYWLGKKAEKRYLFSKDK